MGAEGQRNLLLVHGWAGAQGMLRAGNPLLPWPGRAVGCLCCSSPKSSDLIPNWGHLKGKGTLGDALGWV